MLHLPLIESTALAALVAGHPVLGSLPVVLYIGPDQILPMTSFLGGVVGFLLMFWHKLVALTRKVRGQASVEGQSSHTESGV